MSIILKKADWSLVPHFIPRPQYSSNFGWSRLEHGFIDEYKPNLEPDFQRAHVWDEPRQSAYIEYVLRGGDSGKDIFFNEPHVGCPKELFVIVDGKQRLHAVRQFMDGRVKAFGHTVDDFKKGSKTPILPLECMFVIHINELQTRAEVLQWYLEMNTGGVPHTKAELQKVRDMLAAEKK